MGAFVSIFPFLYARTPKGFLWEDKLIILREAQVYGLTGTIVLKGHLYGDEDKRSEIISNLKKEFSSWEYRQVDCDEKLGWMSAMYLNRLQSSLFTFVNKNRSINGLELIKINNVKRFSENTKIGIIEIDIPSPPVKPWRLFGTLFL